MTSFLSRVRVHVTRFMDRSGLRIPIIAKLFLSFLVIIAFTGAVFGVAGVRLISNRILAAAQEKVRTDLNSAREIYLGKLRAINDVVRFTALRSRLLNPVFSGDLGQASQELELVRSQERLDFLSVTDNTGKVLLRTSNPGVTGDDRSGDELVRAALERKQPVVGTSLATVDELGRESPALAAQASLPIVPPLARGRFRRRETRWACS